MVSINPAIGLQSLHRGLIAAAVHTFSVFKIKYLIIGDLIYFYGEIAQFHILSRIGLGEQTVAAMRNVDQRVLILADRKRTTVYADEPVALLAHGPRRQIVEHAAVDVAHTVDPYRLEYDRDTA